MRPSEPLLLDRDDVDLQRSVLTVQQSKFGKSRFLPVHETTTQALQTYAVRRDRIWPRPLDPAFFLSERRSRISPRTLQETFVKLSGQVGSLGPTDSRGPRPHDLRHRFAVSTLRRWQRDGLDVEGRILQLATYLGHARVSDTYWYLTADPELLQLAARRLDRTARRGPPPSPPPTSPGCWRRPSATASGSSSGPARIPSQATATRSACWSATPSGNCRKRRSTWQ